MKFSWLLFDIDNTLLDFSGACRRSFWSTCLAHDLECNEEIYKQYKGINNSIWEAFERREINAVQLRQMRFQMFFEARNISHLNPLDFNQHYLENIIKETQPYDGVLSLIDDLRPHYKMSVVTNGLKEVQRPRLAKLNMIDSFDSIIVSDEIGVAKPHNEYFENVYSSIPNPPDKSEILIIGDNLKSDILGGLNFGISTCWLSHGAANETDIKPHFQIDTIDEIRGLLNKSKHI